MVNKKNIRTKKSNVRTKKNKVEINYLLLPIIFIICIIPLIVKIYDYNTNAAQFLWFPDQDGRTDFFLYYKSIYFIFSSIAAVVMMGFMKASVQYKFKNSKFFIPLAIYAVLALLSTIFSEYSYFGFHGMLDHFESVYVILGYCLMVYYGYQFISTEKDLKIIINSLLISIGIISLLGLSQYLGKDFFRTEFGTKLILTGALRESWKDIQFEFELGRVYLTFFNPNYVGLYMSIIIPLLLVLLLFSRKIINFLVYLLLIIGMIISLVGSQARNGFVALIITFVIIMIFMRKQIYRNIKYFIPGSLIFIFIFVAIDFQTDHSIVNRLKTIFVMEKTAEPILKEIQTNDDNIKVVYNDQSLLISYIVIDDSAYAFLFQDGEGNDLSGQYDSSTGVINDERFQGITVTPTFYDNKIALGVNINGRMWYFIKGEDETYYHINSKGKMDKIINAETSILKGYERIGSGRGYIWDRTIPLIKDNILLGSGVDTFPIAFPQNDYVGKYNYGFDNTIVDKPHNIYLQTAVQTGLLSLIALIVSYGIYFVWCVRIYFKNNFESFASHVGLGIFVGSIGFIVSGFFNDSNISVSPVFWCIIGVGLAANHMVAAEKNKE